MAANGQLVSVTSTATLLFEVVDGVTYSGLTSPAANIFRSGDENAPLPILIAFPASPGVFLGGSGVTASAGFVVPASFTLSYNCIGGDSLYAITASSTASVSILVLRQ